MFSYWWSKMMKNYHSTTYDATVQNDTKLSFQRYENKIATVRDDDDLQTLALMQILTLRAVIPGTASSKTTLNYQFNFFSPQGRLSNMLTNYIFLARTRSAMPVSHNDELYSWSLKCVFIRHCLTMIHHDAKPYHTHYMRRRSATALQYATPITCKVCLRWHCTSTHELYATMVCDKTKLQNTHYLQ